LSKTEAAYKAIYNSGSQATTIEPNRYFSLLAFANRPLLYFTPRLLLGFGSGQNGFSAPPQGPASLGVTGIWAGLCVGGGEMHWQLKPPIPATYPAG